MNFLTLKREAFGLDISDFSLKFSELKKNKRGLILSSFGEAEIPRGIIEGGEVKDEDSLAKIIRESINKVKGKKLKTKYVIASLPEEKSFLQVIQLPKMTREELKKAIKFEAENYIPLPIEEVYLDFQIVQPLYNHIDHLDVLIAALPKKIIDPYLSSIKKSGLIPTVLEIESQAISRALIKNEVSPSPVLIIDLGATRTSFIIFSGYSLRFTSSILVSSQIFTESISKSMNIDLLEAEKLKQKYGLETREKISFKKKLKGIEFEKEITEDKRIFNALIPPIIDLVEQIKKHLNYYQTHVSHEHLDPGNKESVKKILLCGGGANLKGLSDILSLELKIPVVMGNPWINILPSPLQETPELPYEKSLSYTTALGLALRGVKK
jgi:type IV pilus assembly protein PilM